MRASSRETILMVMLVVVGLMGLFGFMRTPQPRAIAGVREVRHDDAPVAQQQTRRLRPKDEKEEEQAAQLRDRSFSAEIPPPGQLRTVMVALVVRNSASFLPLFLRQLAKQDYPKRLVSLYFRTNNNKDNTTGLLRAYLERHRSEYARVELDARDLTESEELKTLAQDRDTNKELSWATKWHPAKLAIMARLRQGCLEKALAWGTDALFVTDADNFYTSGVLSRMMQLGAAFPIVAPLLNQRQPGALWMSPHYSYRRTDQGNYIWIEGPYDRFFLNRRIRAVVQVPLVQCTYLVRADVLPRLSYLVGSPGLEDLFKGEYEFQVFAVSARRAGIKQYADTTEQWGYALSKLEELNGLEEHLDELEVQAKRRPPYDNVDRYWEG